MLLSRQPHRSRLQLQLGAQVDFWPQVGPTGSAQRSSGVVQRGQQRIPTISLLVPTTRTWETGNWFRRGKAGLPRHPLETMQWWPWSGVCPNSWRRWRWWCSSCKARWDHPPRINRWPHRARSSQSLHWDSRHPRSKPRVTRRQTQAGMRLSPLQAQGRPRLVEEAVGPSQWTLAAFKVDEAGQAARIPNQGAPPPEGGARARGGASNPSESEAAPTRPKVECF